MRRLKFSSKYKKKKFKKKINPQNQLQMKVQIKVLSGEYVHANRHYLADAVFNFTLVNAMLGVSVIYFLPVLLQSIAFFVLSRLKKVLELIGKTLNRSRHQRCSMKNSVLRNFTKFTGKHL